ncbi:hypothetical protein [Lacticaseibacillus nasuensis]|uniref:hypothetical protein n=1 Tax=Lacticaseibacillus nasuensis TaxID=944671 RepID=UPI0006D009E5|nr:hypothetical protein [Lacticaseibacillus nasuensis]
MKNSQPSAHHNHRDGGGETWRAGNQEAGISQPVDATEAKQKRCRNLRGTVFFAGASQLVPGLTPAATA